MQDSLAPPSGGLVERLARRDRRIVIGAVGLIVILSALYTILGPGMTMSALDMTRMARPVGAPMAMGMAPAWGPAYAVLVFLMWWIMMVAMMTPSAAPMLLLFVALKKIGPDSRHAHGYSLLFLLGYLATWAGFSALATGTQWALDSAGVFNGAMMALQSRVLAGAILLAAGLFQFTALKDACLRHCRSPAEYLAAHNRPGPTGAFRMGLRHGTYCLGCCWALMALLFVGGIMNLYWIVALALYVLAEKLAPNANRLRQAAGAALVAAGAYFIWTGLMV